MSRIVIFGAGGRAGRRAVAEAVSRGHDVTAVVRDTGKHAGLARDGVTIVAGDATDTASVAAVAAGHDAAITAAARLDVPAAGFYAGATKALVSGLVAADVRRLVLIGIGTTLETAPGVRVHDAENFPAEYRAISLGHVAQLDALADADLDWLVLAPPPTLLDDTADRTGEYRIGGAQVLPTPPERTRLFSYADLAVALVDEVETPRHHQALVAVDY